jgi:hypothetical protein
MTHQNASFLPKLGEDDKLTPVMVYTGNKMVWGLVISKIAIRVSTWLFSDMAPTYMKIYDANILMVGGSKRPIPVKHPIVHLLTRGISAFHLMPPFSEGVDYDPEETNRKFVPVSAYIGYFRFNGFVRITEISTIDNFLAAAKSEYIPLYDSTMDCPLEPSIKGIEAPMVLLHQTQVTFSCSES